jgi:hypothetical protein
MKLFFSLIYIYIYIHAHTYDVAKHPRFTQQSKKQGKMQHNLLTRPKRHREVSSLLGNWKVIKDNREVSSHQPIIDEHIKHNQMNELQLRSLKWI